MGQGQGQKTALAALALLLLILPVAPVQAQFGVLGRVVSTTLDVRTKAEVTADTEISAGASKRLMDDKQAEWAGVAVLVFAQHVVLAGQVKTEAVKKRVEELVRREKNIRSLTNDILVGNAGSFTRDTALEAQINASLTSTQGISSVNMRWSSTGGRVVVMGVAQSQQEANLALQKIRGTSGVKSVVSRLRIIAPKK